MAYMATFQKKVGYLQASKKKKNSVALVHERTIPTERPPPVGEVSANFFLRIEGCHVVSAMDPPRPLISVFWTGAATFLFK